MNKFENEIIEYRDHLKNLLNYSENTISAYCHDIKDFVYYCSNNNLYSFNDVSEADIRSYISKIHRKGIQPKSIQRVLSSLRGFFNYYYKNNKIEKNPALNVKSPKVSKKLPEILQHEDINLLASVNLDNSIYKDKFLLKRDTAIFEIFYSCGLRLTELAMLNISHINFNESMIRVTGKGRKDRIIPIGRKAMESINDWLLDRKKLEDIKTDALFLSKNGKRISKRSIQLRLNFLAKASGIEQKLYPHKLRHTVATHLLESSGNIRAVQEFLGHENVSTTQIYTHLDNQYLMSVYDKVHPRSKKNNK